MTRDARRHHRVPLIGPVRLSWEDQRGENKFAPARCIDVSEGGMRLESPVAIPGGTRVLLHAERIKLSGAATVKHVARYSGKYILGVELAQSAGEKTLAAIRAPSATSGPAPVL